MGKNQGDRQHRGLALAGALLISACGACGPVCEGAQYTTSQGLCVFDEVGHDPALVERTIDILEHQVSLDHGKTIAEQRAQYSLTSINFYAGDPAEGERIAYVNMRHGYVISNRFIIHLYISGLCGSWWLLAHELLHVIHATTVGWPSEYEDSMEAHPEGWFTHRSYHPDINVRSTEYTTGVRLADEFCESDD
jgi:hypothetical protein